MRLSYCNVSTIWRWSIQLGLCKCQKFDFDSTTAMHLRMNRNVLFASIWQRIKRKTLSLTHRLKSGMELPLIFHPTNYICVNLFFDVCNFWETFTTVIDSRRDDQIECCLGQNMPVFACAYVCACVRQTMDCIPRRPRNVSKSIGHWLLFKLDSIHLSIACTCVCLCFPPCVSVCAREWKPFQTQSWIVVSWQTFLAIFFVCTLSSSFFFPLLVLV